MTLQVFEKESVNQMLFSLLKRREVFYMEINPIQTFDTIFV